MSTPDRQLKAVRIAADMITAEAGNTDVCFSVKIADGKTDTVEAELDAMYADPEGHTHAVIVKHYVHGQAAPAIGHDEIEAARKVAAWAYDGLHGGEHVYVDAVIVCWQHAGQHAAEWTRGIWRV